MRRHNGADARSRIIDMSIANDIPGDGSIGWAEFMVVHALATSAVNLNENDFKRLLENLICVFEMLKNTNGKKNYFERMQDYFDISDT